MATASTNTTTSSPAWPATAGTVYVLTNSSLTNMVKVGYTTRSAAIRARELSGTSLPTPFEVAFESERVANARAVERVVHTSLVGSRIQNGREFFKVTPAEAIAEIQSAIELAKGNAEAGAASANDGQAAEPYEVVVNVPAGVAEVTLKFNMLKVANAIASSLVN